MTLSNWISVNKKKLVRFFFLIPIFAVAGISISHVVSWYDLANPTTWAIYLSIAVEIAAMSAIAATSVRIKGASVWIVFLIVTLIQFIGNVFFCYAEIDILSIGFKTWVELTAPVFESIGSDMSDIVAQRRWLAALQGGLLPLISLTCLHFFIQYDEDDEIDNKESEDDDPDKEVELTEEMVKEMIDLLVNKPIKPKEVKKTDPIVDINPVEKVEEPKKKRIF